METLHIYVTEPNAIDISLVAKTLGTTPHTLSAGNPSFTNGNPKDCNVVLFRSATHIGNDILQHMPGLKHAVRVGTGLDNVDRAFCQQAGIAVYNAPGANADAVAEYVLAAMLMALRNIHLVKRSDIETWDRFKFAGHSVASRRIGIIGFGHIGRLLYEKLHSLGCRDFLLYDPYVHDAPADATLVPLDGLMQHCDIISLHLPLLPQTQHCINAEKLAYLRKNAILLNASRGGVVDEAAVLAQMQQTPFTYIADTVEGEPRVNPALLDNPNIIITPHIASLTSEAETAMVRSSIQNLVDSNTTPLLPTA